MSFSKDKQNILGWMLLVAGGLMLIGAVFWIVRAFVRVILEIH